MTPLRFKAWAREDHEMYYDVQNGLQALGMSSKESLGELAGDPSKFTVMQSIDRDDKYGKEIFEGDRIRYKSFDGSEQITIVPPITDHHWHSELEDCTDIEVIGNIYETPDLLPKAA